MGLLTALRPSAMLASTEGRGAAPLAGGVPMNCGYIIAAVSPSPGPTPFDPASTAANVALSNYYLAILLLCAAVGVIALALGFAWAYHREVLRVVHGAVTGPNPAPLGTTNDEVGVQSSEAEIVGPDRAEKAAELVFTVRNVASAANVTWVAEGSTTSSHSGSTLVTTFTADGEYKVEATYPEQVDGSTETRTLTKAVIIGPHPAASAAANSQGPPIAIPFVVKNWGRLVVVLFGVGVIAALMATRVLESAAGVGILGTLLGAGAVAATGGGTGTPPSSGAGGTQGGDAT